MARARALLTEALRAALRSRGISPAKASKIAGLHDDALNAVFRGARSLPLAEVDLILEATEIPVEELLGYMMSSCSSWQKPPDPPAMLASLREVSHPTSADLRIWLTYNPGIGTGRPLPSLPNLVAEIECLRSKDRYEALERARIWVGTFPPRFRGAAKRSRLFRAEAVCEFALALGMWGSVAACLGLVNDAAFALEHALRLHAPFPLTSGYARLLLWTTSLSVLFGSPQIGMVLADRALSILTCLGQDEQLPLALVARANMSALSGHMSEAAEIAGAVMNHARATPDHLFAARVLRLKSAIEDGDLLAARDELSSAEVLLPSLGRRRQTIWLWHRGRFEIASGRHEPAARTFCGLLALESSALEVVDRFLVFLDLAETLGALGNLVLLKQEASKMKKWLPLLDVSPLSRGIVSSFCQIVMERLPQGTELLEAKDALMMGANAAPCIAPTRP